MKTFRNFKSILILVCVVVVAAMALSFMNEDAKLAEPVKNDTKEVVAVKEVKKTERSEENIIGHISGQYAGIYQKKAE